jgi:hypothetical protein
LSILEDRDMLPLRREADLLVEELADETVVYDRARNKAHCLNQSAALVWRHCDGRTTIAQMAAILHTKLGLPADAAVVRLALDRLACCHLLQDTSRADEIRASRRDLIRKFGVAAVALPVVMTILAPTAGAAGSGTTTALCVSCVGVGLPCINVPGSTCLPEGQLGQCRCK